MRLSDLLARFPDRVEERDGYLIHCPAHQDSRQSLRITVSDKGKVLIRCRAGCETPAVVSALGLTMGDLAGMEAGDLSIVPATSTDTPASPADVAALRVRLDGWAYALSLAGTDGGEAIEAYDYACARFGLEFVDMRRLGLGFATDLGGGPRLVVPFRDRDGVARGFQARALDADAAVRWLGPRSPEGGSWARVGWFPGGAGWDEVLVCEGPGDALTGCALGYDTIGVRGAGLAGNPSVVAEIATMVGDRVAVIAGDGDPSGRTFSATLARSLTDAGVKAKILDLPDGLDLTDWRAQNPSGFARDVIRAVTSATELTSSTSALRSRDESVYPLTDLGNARFARDFVAAQGSGVRYSPEAGFFLLADGVWRPDKLDRARAYVQEAADLIATIADQLFSNAATVQEINDAKRWKSWSRHSQSSRGIDAALRELQALQDVATDLADFDRNPDLLACRNGVVDLRTGTLGPHNPRHLLTRRVDLDFNPSATCPRWERFLDEVFPAYPDLPAFIRRLIGYGITGHTTEQSFAVLWGTGANGKSVFTDTLTEVFRELTVTTPFATFEEKPSGGIPNDLAALKGARLVMAAEGDQGRPMAESVLKRVTGRDLISARFMRKEFFEFRPTFLLLLATNFKPNFRGQDEGLWRRVKLVPWERYFAPAERDHRLGEQLLGEAEGIFAWAVRGAVEWRANGLADPEVIRSSTKEYRETSDALAGFLPGRWVKEPESSAQVIGRILFDDYLAWADEENLPPKDRWTRRSFFGALEERGCVKKKAASGVAFVGIRRARQTDAVPDHAESARADEPREADSSDTSHPTTGPSLDEVF